MSDDNDDAPRLFGDDDGPDADDTTANEATPEPTEGRDHYREIVDTIHSLGAGEAIDLAHLTREIVSQYGYVAEGVIRTAMERALDAGAVELTIAGDPIRNLYRRPKQSADLSQLRAVLLELARLPDDRTVETTAPSAFDIAAALEARTGVPRTVDDVEPMLDALLARKLVEPHQVRRLMPVIGDDGARTNRVEDAIVTVYSIAPGMLFNLLAPGFDALLGAPQSAKDDAATVESTAADRAAVAASFVGRIAEADKKAAESLAQRDDALRRAVDAEKTRDRVQRELDMIRDRLADRGLQDVYETMRDAVLSQPSTKAPDTRGKPVVYEKRIPITVELEAEFWKKDVEIRAEIKRHKRNKENAKEAFDRAKGEADESVALLEQQIDDMTAAYHDGSYLIRVNAAYKVFDTATHRTAVHDYDTGKFVCWDDPLDLPEGAQPALPGMDAHGPNGSAPATEAKSPKGRKPGKAKPAKGPAPNPTAPVNDAATEPPRASNDAPNEDATGDAANDPAGDAGDDSADDVTGPVDTDEIIAPAPVYTEATIDAVVAATVKAGYVANQQAAVSLIDQSDPDIVRGLYSPDQSVRESALAAMCLAVRGSLTGAKGREVAARFGLVRAEKATKPAVVPTDPVVEPAAEPETPAGTVEPETAPTAAPPTPAPEPKRSPVLMSAIKGVIVTMCEQRGAIHAYDTSGTLEATYCADVAQQANMTDSVGFRTVLNAAILSQTKNRILEIVPDEGGKSVRRCEEPPTPEDDGGKRGRRK